MKPFLPVVLISALAFAEYNAYRVTEEFLGERLCFSARCAKSRVPRDGFLAIAFLHCLFADTALAIAQIA